MEFTGLNYYKMPRGPSIQIFTLIALFLSAPVWAENSPQNDAPPNTSPPPTGPGAAPNGAGGPSTDAPAHNDKTVRPEDDDFSGTPYTQYGEFNESSDEEADTQFFQLGRFFGLSLGLGFEAPDGNRGKLWQGGFPLVDIKVHYWFDFNFALDLNFYTVNHYFVASAAGITGVQYQVNMFRAGVDLKYYFTTKNLPAAFSFANPYLIGGVGAFSKSEYTAITGVTPTTLTAVGASAGAGLEFVLSPKKTYIELEGKVSIVGFYDNGSNAYNTSNGLPNLNGNFWTLSTNFLFTW